MDFDHKIRDLQGSSRAFLFRLKRGVVNFKIKDLKARTLFITLGILVAVILIPTGMSYLPQGQQNSTAPGQNNQGDFINTVPAALFDLTNPDTCLDAEKKGTLAEPRCQEWFCSSDGNHAELYSAPYTQYKSLIKKQDCSSCTAAVAGVTCAAAATNTIQSPNQSASCNGSQANITFTWFYDGDTSNIARFVIEYLAIDPQKGENFGATSTGFGSISVAQSSSSYTWTGAQSGTTYGWRIYAVTSNGNSPTTYGHSVTTSSCGGSSGGTNSCSVDSDCNTGYVCNPSSHTCIAGGGTAATCPGTGDRFGGSLPTTVACGCIKGTTYRSDAERNFYCNSCGVSCGSTGGGSTVPAPVPINNPPAQTGGGSGANCTPGSATVSSQCNGTDIAPGGGTIYQYPSDYDQSPTSVSDCKFACDNDPNCRSWVYVPAGATGSYGGAPTCYEKGVTGPVVANNSTTAGIKGSGSSNSGNATCTGDAKVLCGTQCYGVVAGACKNWQCVNGAPKCMDTASNGGTTGGGSNTTAPGTQSGDLCASFGGLAGCNAYAKKTYGDSFTCNSTCTQFGNQANGGAPGGNSNTGNGNTGSGNTGTISCNTVCKQQATPVGTYCGNGSPTNGACACTLCTVLSGSQDTSGNPVNKSIPVSNNSTNQPGSTATNTPTATLPANSASIAFNLTIPGVGNGGNGINNSPTPASRTLEITATSNGQDKSASGQLTYDPTSGSFKGTVSIPNATGLNTIKARFNNSLWKSLGNLTLTANQSVSAQSAELITGDINQDNELNLLDYNLLISCFGSKSCNNKEQSDLNVDGKVDEADLNILYSVFSERQGQ